VVNPPAHDKSKDHSLPRRRGALPDVGVGSVGDRYDAALNQQGLLGHVRPEDGGRVRNVDHWDGPVRPNVVAALLVQPVAGQGPDADYQLRIGQTNEVLQPGLARLDLHVRRLSEGGPGVWVSMRHAAHEVGKGDRTGRGSLRRQGRVDDVVEQGARGAHEGPARHVLADSRGLPYEENVTRERAPSKNNLAGQGAEVGAAAPTPTL
jgi:hypothetical protein